MTTLQRFKLDLVTSFINWNTHDEISDETRSLLLKNALTFAENEDSGFPLLTDDDIENLKVMYNYVDEDSNLAKSMHKVLVIAQDFKENPNEGLITWEYIMNNRIDEVKKSVKIRKATKKDNKENCYDNVSLIFEQLIGEGVIGFDVEEGLKWK